MSEVRSALQQAADACRIAKQNLDEGTAALATVENLVAEYRREYDKSVKEMYKILDDAYVR